LAQLQDCFFWGFIINIVIYVLQLLLCLGLRKSLIRSHRKLFGVGEEAINKAIYSYFGSYKIVINAFFLAPWIALTIVS